MKVRTQVILVVALIGALLATASSASASEDRLTSDVEVENEVHLQTTEEVIKQDTEDYSKRHDVSYDVALDQQLTRLEAQPILDAADAHPDFAAARTIRQPGGGLYVELHFKGTTPPEIRALGGPVRYIENVGWTAIEMDDRQAQIHEDLTKAGFTDIGSIYDIDTGRIEVVVSRKEPGERRGEAALLPESLQEVDIDVVMIDGPGGSDDDIGYGGDTTRQDAAPNWRCTTGFTIKRASGFNDGVVTAGHCNQQRYMDPNNGTPDFDMPFLDQHRGKWGDEAPRVS